MVTNLINSNGKAVANQFVLTEGDMIVFQSYNSRVCELCKGSMGFDRVVRLGRDFDYSKTTVKHLLNFLRDNGFSVDSIADLRWAIDRGYFRYDQAIAVIYDDTMF